MATNERPQMHTVRVAYANAEGATEVKDVRAAYSVENSSGDLVQFKDDDHKIVFTMPKNRLVYIDVDHGAAGAAALGIPAVHNRAVTDRLKAADRCVTALFEAIRGETQDGVLDYDQARESLVSRVEELRARELVPGSMLAPGDVAVVTDDAEARHVIGYRYEPGYRYRQAMVDAAASAAKRGLR